MFKLSDLLEILGFQLKREITNLAIVSLEELEKTRDSRKKLETILINLGFDDKELLSSDKDYQIARKLIWDRFNNTNRQLKDLIDKFNIKEEKKV